MGSAAGKLCSKDNTGEMLDALERIAAQGHGVYGFEVSGAGNPIVNGTYARTGIYCFYPLFTHVENPDLWLYYNQNEQWCIGDKNKLEETEGDYYQAPAEGRLPPIYGWEADSDGSTPAPCLKMVAEGPAAFVVSGAGFGPANGRYVRDGVYDGSALYKNGQYVLFRARTNWFEWYIADKDKIDEVAGDLYKCAIHSDFPSAHGWEVIEPDGRGPAPTIAAVDANGAALDYGWHPAAPPMICERLRLKLGLVSRSVRANSGPPLDVNPQQESRVRRRKRGKSRTAGPSRAPRRGAEAAPSEPESNPPSGSSRGRGFVRKYTRRPNYPATISCGRGTMPWTRCSGPTTFWNRS